MKEIILCKYGELILKGLNKSNFEVQLLRTLRHRLKPYGAFRVSHAQSTIYVEPLDDGTGLAGEADIEGAAEACCRVFGIIAVNRAAVVEKDMDAIRRCAAEYLPRWLEGVPTFKADARRADKTFPLKSPEIAAEIGAVVLENVPHIRVDVEHPAATVRVEIREQAAYVHAIQRKGAGGMPVGSNGRGLLLLSGGIDSPVAGFMMAKRGMTVEALHFESFPYTSERAREKVFSLASEVASYSGSMKVHVISLTHIQEMLRDGCDEEFFTLLLRRFMMRLADRAAETYNCGALITGESLGQVASQTAEALRVTDAAASRPVFRPCIGMDKEEIITIARRIGTFDTSILPYEDCCTVFTPRHPKTRPTMEQILAQEAKFDLTALEDEAFSAMYTQICPPAL